MCCPHLTFHNALFCVSDYESYSPTEGHIDEYCFCRYTDCRIYRSFRANEELFNYSVK